MLSVDFFHDCNPDLLLDPTALPPLSSCLHINLLLWEWNLIICEGHTIILHTENPNSRSVLTSWWCEGEGGMLQSHLNHWWRPSAKSHTHTHTHTGGWGKSSHFCKAFELKSENGAPHQRLCETPLVFQGTLQPGRDEPLGRAVRKGTRVSHPFVTPAVMSGCWRGLTNCARWHWCMQVSAPTLSPNTHL